MTDHPAPRRHLHPDDGETWHTLAARVMPDKPADEAVGLLQSWNMHVFMRPAAPAGSRRKGNPILPSDVLFVDPPL
jgi:hypothetical protein